MCSPVPDHLEGPGSRLCQGAQGVGCLNQLENWGPGPHPAGVLPPGEVGSQAHAADSFMPNLPLILGLGNYLKYGQILDKLFYQI